MKKIVMLAFLATSFYGISQTASGTTATTTTVAPVVQTEKEWDVSLYGFIRADYIFDTRKSAQVREYNLNLYPLDEALDATQKDINDVGASNFLSVVSRLGVKAKGPNVWGAKTSGTLEGDFFGNTESSIGLFRLRHAYVSLDWAKTSITMGQTWYPTFIPEVFPGVANFNTGILFNPFGWATQVKLKQNFTKELSFTVTAYKEREFTTAGGVASPTDDWSQNSGSINSALPTFHGQLQFKGKSIIAGLGAEYKSLQPLTKSNGLATSEKVNCASFVGYFKYFNDKFSVKAFGITGENMSSLVMLGGYAGYTLPGAGQVEKYEASKTSSFWIDIASNGKKIAPGVFFGYTKNEGTDKNGLAVGETVKYYMRGVTGSRVIDNVWRTSARVDLKQNKFRLTPELEYTAVTWGTLNPNANATADLNQKDFSNFRAMISCAYSF